LPCGSGLDDVGSVGDPLDAAASVAALVGDGHAIVADDLTCGAALLEERRGNVAAHRTRLVNQLHALLHDLAPGGGTH